MTTNKTNFDNIVDLPVADLPVFIVLRHVSNELSNKYWQHACECIRKFYPFHKIYIIDDNSKQEYVTAISDANTIVIQSEFPPGKGEILPYYYFYTQKLAQKAYIIHDSVFINTHVLDVECNDIQFLWSFGDMGFLYDYREIEQNLLSKLNFRDELIKLYNSGCPNWYGCFGVMSYITWDFLANIESVYNFFSLIPFINSRQDRCSLERAFAIICQHYQKIPIRGIYNSIHKYSQYLAGKSFELTYNNYIVYSNYFNVFANTPVIKIWSGR